MLLSKLIELLEAMAVDDLLEVAIGIVADETIVIEDHQLAVLSGIGFPGRKRRDVRIAGVGELRPNAAHHVGQLQVFCRRLGQLVGWVMEGVETELQLVAMHGAFVDRRAPGEHVHVEVRGER